MTEAAKDLTIEEMLDDCIRTRSESRSQVVGQLDDVLTALNRGQLAPKAQNDHDLWVLHSDGSTKRYANQ